MSYCQTLYHIVFATKFRNYTIPKNSSSKLYKLIQHIILDKNSRLYAIGGMADHIHILCNLHQDIALSNLVKTIKGASSKWLSSQSDFPDFDGWGKGYGAFTHSYNEKDILIQYIENQEEHHKKEAFDIELGRLLKEQYLNITNNILLG